MITKKKEGLKRWKSQKQYSGYMTIKQKKAIEHNRFHVIDTLPVYNCSIMSMEQAIRIYLNCKSKQGNSKYASRVVSDIRKPAPKEVMKHSEVIYKKILRILPSLSRENELRLSPEGVFPDIGRVACGEPDCMLARLPSPQTASHKTGSMGFRVIISTDCVFGGTAMGAAMMSMNKAIAMIMPCEIYIQQGWLRSVFGQSENYNNESIHHHIGSVNLISLPANMDPGLLWFWCGSFYKDAEFSGTIAHQYLKSPYTGVSKGPEIPCDIFTQDDHLVRVTTMLNKMGVYNLSNEDVCAFWISKIISEKFMDKKPIDNPEIMDYISEVKKNQ